MSNTAPPNVSPILPGTVLAGKYRVARIIGQGGMGLVVEAYHIALDERVALKFLLPDYASHPEASERFHREARNAAKIKSEHVARVTDVGKLETGAPYMVMEFLEGRDLSKTLDSVGVLSAVDAIDYVIQGCEAIAEAHAIGIVHRDLKPANLFLSKRPDGSPIVKVLDFGISKLTGGVENLTKTMMALGSALYMSPEQMQQTRAVDHRTDIYALGISLYELLAGKQPFYAETLPQLCAEILTGTPTPLRTARPDLSGEFAQVIEKAYARDRAERYQSIADFVMALAPFAPPRSQTTIERIARMAGLPIPGAGDRAPSPPFRGSNPELQGRSGTQLIPQSNTPPPWPAPAQALSRTPPGGQPFTNAPPQGAPPQTAPGYAPQTAPGYAPQGHGSYPPPLPPPLPPHPPTEAMLVGPGGEPVMAQQALRPGTDPNQIIPGHYSAPRSARAAASFAHGPLPPDVRMPGMERPGLNGFSRLVALTLAITGIVALGALAMVFALRTTQVAGAALAQSTEASAAPSPDTPATAKPDLVKTAAPAETPKLLEVTPPPPASASAAPPLLSATASASAIRRGVLRPPASSSSKAPPSATPTASSKPADIYGTSH